MHDHRRLGRELELFDTDPLVGAGLPYWLPAGAAAIAGIAAQVSMHSPELWAGADATAN